MNLLQIIFLALLGLSAGMIVAGGVFSFIVELGVISDFADRTHTGNHILIYEDMVAAGKDDISCNLWTFRRDFCWLLGNGTCRNFECISHFYETVKDCPVSRGVCGNGCIRERNRSGIVFLEKMVNSTASFLSASAPAPFFLSLTPAPETFPFSFLSQPASFLQNISDK